MKQILLFWIGLFLTVSSFAQSIDNYFISHEHKTVPKLYLHTDREYYFRGDTLWFSPYLLDGKSNKLILDDCNLYVDLIDDKGEIVKKGNFFLDKGMCSGYLFLDGNTIPTGTYVLRGYTDHLKSFDEDFFFRKTIKINHIRQRDENAKSKETNQVKVNLEFYPEGGFLLDKKVNRMAFVARDQKGGKVDLKCKLVSNTGEEFSIETDYNGMGSFMFIPKLGRDYKIENEEKYKIKFSLPNIRTQGSKLMLSKITNKAIRLNIISSDSLTSDEFYIAMFHRGEGINYVKIEKDKLSRTISIKSDYLRSGVNKIVLLNTQFEPLSERLVFVNKDKEDYLIQLDLNKDKFETREKVKMKLSLPNAKSDEWARLSVSVVNENMVGYQDNLVDIKSYLLLDSELKGQIQTPGLFFVDDENISSVRKLDLLMLTNGWRNYTWDCIKNQEESRTQKVASGITFSGNVKKIFTNKPYVNTDVFLNIVNKDLQKMVSTKTDSNGCFKFDSIVLYDTTMVMIQGKNYKNKNNTRLLLNDFGLEHLPVRKSNFGNIEDIGELSTEMRRLKYINELALMKFYPERDSKLLNEICIVANREKKRDTHFRLYPKNVTSKKISDIDRNSNNIFDYMKGRFAGVIISNEAVFIRTLNIESAIGGSKEAFLLLDGVPVDFQELEYMGMHDIDMIEIVKPPETAIFGARGANGVVSVFTRSGYEYKPVAKKIPGTIIKKIKGFEKFCTFYSPVYTSKNIDSKIPDYRQTIYWNPSVFVDSKTKSLSFFTSDNLANYKILVEGISKSGKVCTGKIDFVVDERR